MIATPAYTAAHLVGAIAAPLARLLSGIAYAGLAVAGTGYHANQIGELDGFGVLEALRRRLVGRAVPVVVVTVHDDPATEARCIELGAEDYLTKPIQPSSLVVRVRAVLRRAGVQYAWPRS